MALFENYFKTKATADLEKNIKILEERIKITQTKQDLEKNVVEMESNVSFSKRINLISETQASEFRQRLQKIEYDLKRSQKQAEARNMENRKIKETTSQYQSMDDYKAEIERMKETKQSNDDKSDSSQTQRNKTAEDEEELTR